MASNGITPTNPETQSPAIRNANAPFDAADADVILRSSDNVDFRTFKILLCLASPVFKSMFSLPQKQDEEGGKEEMLGGLPVVSMSEDSIAVERLLLCCHPISTGVDVVGDKIEDIVIALEVAHKYDMEGAKRRAQAVLVASRFLDTEPIRIYAIACRFRLRDEAKIAAKYALRIDAIPPYAAELEYVTGGDLLRLQKYHQACGQAASGLIEYFKIWVVRSDFVWFTCDHCDYWPGISHGIPPRWVCPRTWWMDFMKETSAALRIRPCSATVLQPDRMTKALQRASACETCREKAFSEMKEFVKLYAATVEKVTLKIELELKF